MHAGLGTDPAKVPAKRSVSQRSFQEAIESNCWLETAYGRSSQRFHLNEEVLALHRCWRPDISQVRILPFRLICLRSSVDRAPGFDPGCRRFESCRGLVLRRSLRRSPQTRLFSASRIASILTDFRKPTFSPLRSENAPAFGKGAYAVGRSTE